MAGGMFAGHDESGGEVTVKPDGKKVPRYRRDTVMPSAGGDCSSRERRPAVPQVKLFYGMSSATAMKKHSGGVAEYRASEGKTVEVAYKGPVGATLLGLYGGLRSACTYVGAATLAEMERRTTFIRVSQQVNTVFTGREV